MSEAPAAGRPDVSSFDDHVLTSAQNQARILRELGYHAEAAHIERLFHRPPAVEDESAA